MMNGLEVGMRFETRRGMQNRYACERANVEATPDTAQTTVMLCQECREIVTGSVSLHENNRHDGAQTCWPTEVCECGLRKRGSHTDEKFTVRCGDCLLPIKGALDAWTMRFAPLTEVQLQNVMAFPHGALDCDRRCPAHVEGE